MSELTPNLKLFKYNTETDAKQPFSINDCMNANWDKIDASLGSLEICDIGMALYVDETKGKRRYLNGQIVERNANTEAFFTRLKEITTLHPSLLCTEEEWQTAKTMSAFGQVGKFVFNYSGGEIVSVRLPRVVNVQGLFDLQNLGMTVNESLPNITGGFNLIQMIGSDSANGAFQVTKTATNFGSRSSGSQKDDHFTFDASRSSSTYKDNAPVQQEAIQYPYFIQIATGSETENNIINEIELNNPYSLFDSKYSDHELNNLSWLKSEGQWNAKAVYTEAYDKLLKVYNGTETVEGLSVKLSTETYTDYDFVLNMADETFRLPLKTNMASGKAVVGNGITIGLTSDLGNAGMIYRAVYQDYYGLNPYKEGYGLNVGSTSSGSTPAATDMHAVGLTTDPTKSGIETSDSGLYLYYYVGETVQNANLIDAGRIGEQLANKVDVSNTQWAINAYMPDYSAGVSIGLRLSSNPYTAPSAGIISVDNLGQNQTETRTYLVINGIKTNLGSNSASSYTTVSSLIFPVNVGDVCYFSASLPVNSVYFYPLKGGN